jgi:hypothetical protein
MAHRLGPLSESRIYPHKPRREIVQIMNAAERFTRQHQQRLDQFFWGAR